MKTVIINIVYNSSNATPLRWLDYSAYVVDTEKEGPYGHGKTEQEAFMSLIEQLHLGEQYVLSM